jgi:cysteine-rich repeat protein
MRTSALLVVLLLAQSPVAEAATCEADLFGDGVCDCGCGNVDPDCPQGTFQVCERSHCAAGKVPWEHSPESCMSSACGDGWNDPARGEACDDGNAVSSGGCSAGCAAVNPGFACGERATGCQAAPTQPGSGATDAGAVDSPAPDAGTDEGGDTRPSPVGCTSVPGTPLLLAAALWATRRRAG